MSDAKTIVILGGGVGGVVAATSLRRSLPKHHQVVLVDREPNHLFAPSLLWLMTGRRSARQITRPLSQVAKKGVEVVIGEIESIDPAGCRVRVSGAVGGDRELEADYLIVSLGAELDSGAIPGLAKAGHSFYTLAGAASFRDALARFSGGRIVVLTATPAYKCPAAPYEAAMLVEADVRGRGISEQTRIDLYSAEPGPLGVAGPEVSAGVRRMVEAKGIGYHPEHQVVGVDPETRQITFKNGSTIEFDLLAYVPPHRAPRVIRESALVDASGWIPVDRDALHTRFANVYAVGDVTAIPLVMGKPLPKAGVFAERQARVVARNITTALTDKGRAAGFDGHGECFVETGDNRAGYGRGDFYAEPLPQVKLYAAGRRWHLAKVAFEKNWFRRWL